MPAVAGMDRLGISTLLTLIILLGVSMLGFFSRLFAVIRFESIIHEFDPWFNYRATYQMVTMGFYDFLNWFDELAWYPLGRIVGGTVYPGLMITAGSIHWFLNALGMRFLSLMTHLSQLFFKGNCVQRFCSHNKLVEK